MIQCWHNWHDARRLIERSEPSAACLLCAPSASPRLAEDFQKAEGIDLRKDRQALQVRSDGWLGLLPVVAQGWTYVSRPVEAATCAELQTSSAAAWLGLPLSHQLTPPSSSTLASPHPPLLQRLTEAAEKAKIELSATSQTSISLPFITATAEGPKHIDTSLTRAKFEQLCSDLLERCRIPVEQALKVGRAGEGWGCGLAVIWLVAPAAGPGYRLALGSPLLTPPPSPPPPLPRTPSSSTRTLTRSSWWAAPPASPRCRCVACVGGRVDGRCAPANAGSVIEGGWASGRRLGDGGPAEFPARLVGSRQACVTQPTGLPLCSLSRCHTLHRSAGAG